MRCRPPSPLASFYFGSFRNNYVDDRPEKRYRELESFPGFEIDEIAARRFGKLTGEVNLPPVRFAEVGTPLIYLSYIRPAVFAGAMLAAVDRFLRRERLDFLSQLGRRAGAKGAYAFDEIGFADRERARQRIIDCGRFDSPAVPKTRRRGVPAEAPVARRDAEIDWRRECGRGHKAKV